MVDADEIAAILFDKSNVAVRTAAIHLNGHFQIHMVIQLSVIIDQLAVNIHECSLLYSPDIMNDTQTGQIVASSNIFFAVSSEIVDGGRFDRE